MPETQIIRLGKAKWVNPRFRPDPKPSKRIVDDRAGIEKVKTEKRCRVCRSPNNLNRHHLIPRSLGGDDVDANLIPLCGSGTTGCHGVFELRAPGWQHYTTILRRRMTAEELAYVLNTKGVDFLERYYPHEASS